MDEFFHSTDKKTEIEAPYKFKKNDKIWLIDWFSGKVSQGMIVDVLDNKRYVVQHIEKDFPTVNYSVCEERELGLRTDNKCV